MSLISPHHICNLAQFLDAPLGKITKKGNLYVRENNPSTIGIINIIFALLKESKSQFDTKVTEEAFIHQWLEYTLVHVGNANTAQNLQIVLKELNNLLSSKTYLIGHKLTVADAFLYYVLVNIMANMTNLDKEKYLNVSRWFDNIQQDSKLRQNNKIVDFSTNYLANVVPARH